MNKFAFSIGELVRLPFRGRGRRFSPIFEVDILRAVKWHRMTWVLRDDLLAYLAKLPACELKASTAPTMSPASAASSMMTSSANAPQPPDKTASPTPPHAAGGSATIPSPTARRSPRNRPATAKAADVRTEAMKRRARMAPRRPAPAKWEEAQ